MVAGAALAAIAGLVGIELSFHAGVAAGASVALVCLRGGALGAALPTRSRAAERAAPRPDDRRPERQHADADQLGLRQPGHHRVVAAHQLDQQPLASGEDQVEAEQHTRGEAVAQVPEHQRREAHGQRLVDGRGVHLLGGGHRAVGVGHGPGQVGGHAVVAVARQLAAHAADRVAQGQRQAVDVAHLPGEPAPPGRPQDHPDRTAHHAAEPDQPRAGEDVAQQVVRDLAPVLDQEVDPRAHQPTDQGGEDDLVGPVGRLAHLGQAAAQHGAGGQPSRARSRCRRSGARSARCRSPAARPAAG